MIKEVEYRSLNDFELVYLANEHNEEALKLLIDKYKKLILIILKDLTKEYNVMGVEISDLYQEGLIGLMHAINTFDKDKEVLFYTYASTCIKKSIFSLIRTTFRDKNKILNNSYSLDKLFENSKDNMYEILIDSTKDPNKIMLEEEENNELINSIEELLSKNEKIIFDLKLKGLSNKEISSLLEKDIRYVENTIYRIGIKYKSYINEANMED